MSMTSTSIPNHEADLSPWRESKCEKPRGLGTDNRIEQVKLNRTRWRTQTEQQIYSTKLVEALRKVRQDSDSQRTSSASCLAVRETADRVLAVAAKGRTRWSRAILTRRLSLKMKRVSNKHQKPKKVRLTGDIRSKKPAYKKRLPAIQRKVRVLGRLVPGCRKLSFPSLLDEATDYIAALQMQVRVMTALNGLLTGVSSLSAPFDRFGSNHP